MNLKERLVEARNDYVNSLAWGHEARPDTLMTMGARVALKAAICETKALFYSDDGSVISGLLLDQLLDLLEGLEGGRG